MREFHKWEEELPVQAACEKLVQVGSQVAPLSWPRLVYAASDWLAGLGKTRSALHGKSQNQNHGFQRVCKDFIIFSGLLSSSSRKPP